MTPEGQRTAGRHHQGSWQGGPKGGRIGGWGRAFIIAQTAGATGPRPLTPRPSPLHCSEPTPCTPVHRDGVCISQDFPLWDPGHC